MSSLAAAGAAETQLMAPTTSETTEVRNMIALINGFIEMIKGKGYMDSGVKSLFAWTLLFIFVKESDEWLLIQEGFQLHWRLASLLSSTISCPRQVKLIRITSPQSSSYSKSSSSLLIHIERQ